MKVLFVAALALAGAAHRSTAAKHAFQRGQPCPSTGSQTGKCPGYVIDHVWPLCAGGVDAPSNMQWQTVLESVEKDRWERRLCKSLKK